MSDFVVRSLLSWWPPGWWRRWAPTPSRCPSCAWTCAWCMPRVRPSSRLTSSHSHWRSSGGRGLSGRSYSSSWPSATLGTCPGWEVSRGCRACQSSASSSPHTSLCSGCWARTVCWKWWAATTWRGWVQLKYSYHVKTVHAFVFRKLTLNVVYGCLKYIKKKRNVVLIELHHQL